MEKDKYRTSFTPDPWVKDFLQRLDDEFGDKFRTKFINRVIATYGQKMMDTIWEERRKKRES